MIQDTLDFAHLLGGAKDNQESQSILSSALDRLGYGSFIYALLPSNPAGILKDPVILDTFNPEWMRQYVSEELHKTDFAAAYTFNGGPPMLWSDMFAGIQNGRIEKIYKKTADATQDWGYRNGVSFSIDHIGPFKAVASIVADSSAGTTDHAGHFERNRTQITALLDSFHASIDRQTLGLKYHGITRRELEVLKWLSEGLLAKEIAYKTGTSVHTVQKQMKSVKLRLSSATVTQAVAKAVMMGLLH